MDRVFAEQIDTLLRGYGFRAFYNVALRDEVRRWRHELLTNQAMDEPTRKGFQIALAAVQEGIKRVFEKAGVSLPHWLIEELALHEYDT